MSSDNPYQSPAIETPLYDNMEYLESQLGPRESTSFVDLLFAFQGRMSRLAYWIINIVATIAYLALAISTIVAYGPESEMASTIALILYIPFGVSMFAAQVKRWHDRNKSGWWILVGLVPVIGPWWVFIECGLMPGNDGENSYGPPPQL